MDLSVRLTKFLALPILAALIALPSTPVLAWGREGHQVIAMIAENHLSPAAAARVAALLQVERGTSLADISNWADAYRDTHPETASWHFVDIPVGEQHYNAKRDCPGNNCVVAKIYEMANYLRNPKTPLDGQVMALKYLVHFVGDIHQPLHCADHNDQGGNRVRIVLGRGQPILSLHSLWDNDLVAMIGGHDAKALADQLDAKISADDIKSWLGLQRPEEWANESHEVAVSKAYGALPTATAGRAILVDQAYIDAAALAVGRQLEAAGIRLASTLNAVFKK